MELSIHRTETITLKTVKHKREDGTTFYATRLKVTGEDDNLELVLFSDDTLSIELED